MKKTLTKLLLATATPCAVILPLVTLSNCAKTKDKEETFTLEVDGAGYNEEQTKLELNADSTIVLVPEEGTEISSISTVRVGSNTLTSDQYTFTSSNNHLVIKAAAMTAKTIYVKVTTSTIFDIKIDGDATYNKNTSKLALYKDSTIVLVPSSGHTITSIETVEVGGEELEEEQYSFSESTQTLTIKAAAMTDTTIYIKIGETEESIKWADGWYAYEKHTSGASIYSNFVNVEFDLANKLKDGEVLTFTVDTTEATEQVELKYESLTVEDTKVTIPMRLRTPRSYIEFGDYVYYDITFRCTNGDQLVWSHTIKDCYFFLLFAMQQPTASTSSYTAGTGIADVESKTTVNVPHEKFDEGELTLKAEVKTTSRPGTSTADIQLMTDQTHPYKSDGLLYQKVKISDTTGLTSGDTFEFSIKFTVTLALFPERPIEFSFENVKLVYR